MSLANVARFYEELPNNQELKEKIESITKKYTDQEIAPQQLTAALQAELLPIFKEAGYEFTLEEYTNYHAQTKQNAAVDDNELDHVVGGFTDSEGYWMTTCLFYCEHYKDVAYWPSSFNHCCCTCYYYEGSIAQSVNEFERNMGKTYRCTFPR